MDSGARGHWRLCLPVLMCLYTGCAYGDELRKARKGGGAVETRESEEKQLQCSGVCKDNALHSVYCCQCSSCALCFLDLYFKIFIMCHRLWHWNCQQYNFAIFNGDDTICAMMVATKFTRIESRNEQSNFTYIPRYHTVEMLGQSK